MKVCKRRWLSVHLEPSSKVINGPLAPDVTLQKQVSWKRRWSCSRSLLMTNKQQQQLLVVVSLSGPSLDSLLKLTSPGFSCFLYLRHLESIFTQNSGTWGRRLAWIRPLCFKPPALLGTPEWLWAGWEGRPLGLLFPFLYFWRCENKVHCVLTSHPS